MKINNFRGDLTDISAEKETLFTMCFAGVWRGLRVAVKTVVFQGVSAGNASMQRAAAEASIAYNLAHPNIVVTYSYDLKPMSDSHVRELNSWKLYLIQVRLMDSAPLSAVISVTSPRQLIVFIINKASLHKLVREVGNLMNRMFFRELPTDFLVFYDPFSRNSSRISIVQSSFGDRPFRITEAHLYLYRSKACTFENISKRTHQTSGDGHPKKGSLSSYKQIIIIASKFPSIA